MFISAVNVMDEVLEFYTKYSEAGRSQI